MITELVVPEFQHPNFALQKKAEALRFKPGVTPERLEVAKELDAMVEHNASVSKMLNANYSKVLSHLKKAPNRDDLFYKNGSTKPLVDKILQALGVVGIPRGVLACCEQHRVEVMDGFTKIWIDVLPTNQKLHDSPTMNVYLNFDSAYETAKAQCKAKKDNEKRQKALANPKVGAALKFLADRKRFDVLPEDARDTATEIRREELIAEATAKGGFVAFGGDDNCEGCEGWDMEDRRCQCGNRRVYWDSDGEFDNMTIYAQAD